MAPGKIIQIVPAEGWKVRYSEDGDPMPLACWALVEQADGKRNVVGIEVEPEHAVTGKVWEKDAHEYIPPSE